MTDQTTSPSAGRSGADRPDADMAALAASTAQGWAHALNTVARPAAEHLEAAQEALTVLQRHDRPRGPLGAVPRFPAVARTLEAALEAARLRVDGSRPAGSITIAELRGALDELTALGLGARPLDPLTQAVRDDGAADRIAELEQELEESLEQYRGMVEALDRQRQLRDRFELEAAQARKETKLAHAGHSAAVDAGRQEQDRQRLRWLLAQLGMNAPGFDEMPPEELRETASQALGATLKEAQALRLVVKELARAGRRLQAGLDGLTFLPSEEKPVELAEAVSGLADQSYRARQAALARQAELEDQLAMAETAPAPDEVLIRQLDHVTAVRDAEAVKLRATLAELEAAQRERDGSRADVERWTGNAIELIRAMEPGLTPQNLEGQALRHALAAAVRRQVDRVEAIGDRLGREEKISAEQRRRAEAAEAELSWLRAAVIRKLEANLEADDRAGTYHQLTTRGLVEELEETGGPEPEPEVQAGRIGPED